MNIQRYFSKIFLATVFVIFILFSTFVTFVTDWWWFSEINHTHFFIKSLVTKLELFFGVGIFVLIFLLSNFYASIRSQVPWVAVLPLESNEYPVSVSDRSVKKIALVVGVVASLFFGLIASANWSDVLKFISGSPFGMVDPLFNKDIGFYIFSLPLLQNGLAILKMLLIVTIAGTSFVYFLRGSLHISGVSLQALRQLHIEKAARLHLGALLSILLLVVASGIYFSLFTLLTTQNGLVFGATYTDATIRVVTIWISILITIFASISAMFWAWSGKLNLLIGSAFIYIFFGVIGAVVPLAIQKLIVAPNELVKETPFIKHNIAATRQAFALDKIEEREISGGKPLTGRDITANNLTIKNVRLWDRTPLLSTFSQLQEIRTYYEFAEVDNDRYIINKEIRQIMLSPREMSTASLPNKNWINERLTFTHGYGVAAGPVNQVTPEGLPVLFVKDLPPKSDVKELEITRPEIYFGELSNDYVVVKTKSLEFDYPKGEENVYSTYAGDGGVEIDSFIKRIFFAVKFKSLELLLSNDIQKDSRIMYYRTIKERVNKIAPFLTFDRDPYIVIAEGKVYWIADAYTTSSKYPYSQPSKLNGESINYIRSSVKVVINAYDGKITLYQIDTEDPIIKTYATIFPGMFRPVTEIPKSLVSHLRYPEDIFTLQTRAYTVYHMDDPQIFYNKEDQWEIPAIPTEGEGDPKGGIVLPMQPRHSIMKLPGEKKEEYVSMLPFTPRAKDNLSAWIVSRNDGENYGKLLVYRFPKDKLVFGPKQVIGRINQHPEISQQLSLWSQGGSQVIQGPLLVIPIEESLLYVRPLYLKAESGKIPELKRVIVAYENKIAMEETLEGGLGRIFGSGLGLKSQSSTSMNPETRIYQNIQERIRNASNLYDEAIRSQKAGDWSQYGELIKRLGDTLKE